MHNELPRPPRFNLMVFTGYLAGFTFCAHVWVWVIRWVLAATGVN